MEELVEPNKEFSQPFARKVKCPIIDIHTHTSFSSPSISNIKRLVKAADDYQISKLIGIAYPEDLILLEKNFPNKFINSAYINRSELDSAIYKIKHLAYETLSKMLSAGLHIIL